MAYLGTQLNVNLENAEFLVAMELVQAPTVGEIQRRGYVDGWKKTAYVMSYLPRQMSAGARHGGIHRVDSSMS